MPQEHAEFVGGFVEGWRCNVAVHSQQIEASVAGELDVAAKCRWFGGCEIELSGGKVRALEIDAFAVDRPHPILHRDLAHAGAHSARMADDSVDHNFYVHVAELLSAK